MCNCFSKISLVLEFLRVQCEEHVRLSSRRFCGFVKVLIFKLQADDHLVAFSAKVSLNDSLSLLSKHIGMKPLEFISETFVLLCFLILMVFCCAFSRRSLMLENNIKLEMERKTSRT